MRTPILRALAVAAATAVTTTAVPALAGLRIVTTITDLADFARTIGGDRVDVEAICHGKQDPHFLQARPSYMVRVSRADLVVAVGLELEIAWLPSLIQGARNPQINPGRPGYFDASSAIEPIDVPTGPVDRSSGDIHPLGNPHYWLDPLNAKRVVVALANRMGELDPDGAATFRDNSAAFAARIDGAMPRWHAAMAPYRGTKIVSYHQTYNYFHRRFGLVGIAYVEERPGIPPAPAHLAHLIRLMRSESIPVIFHESYYDRSASDLVASRTGAKVLVLPTSVGGVDGIEHYEGLIDYLIKEATAGLGSKSK